MRRIVRQVREEGAARADLLRGRDGLRDREVQRVRPGEQRVQDQDVETRELRAGSGTAFASVR